jgi:heme O synthase-like polyprenyltransferase
MSSQALVTSLALIPVSLIPALNAHTFYLVLNGILSAWLFYYGASLAFQRSALAARRLLTASIIYLPMVFFLIAIEKF